MNNDLTVRKELQLKADVTRIWEVLTKPEWTHQYMFGCKVESDWTVGSPILWKADQNGISEVFVKGKIVAIEAGRLLQYTAFDPNSGLEDEPENYTTVTYSLVPEHGHTVLTLSQGNFARVPDGHKKYDESQKGWELVLESIKTLTELKSVMV